MDIREKIAKLLEKARSTTFEGEAEALLAKAAAMMEAHGLEAWELNDGSDPMGSQDGLKGGSGPASYKPAVQRALGKYYGCITMKKRYSGGRFQMELNGPLSARVTTELMTEFVWDQIKAEASRLAKEGEGERGALIRAIANAFRIRVNKLIEERERTAPTNAAAKHALIVVDQTRAYFDARYPGAIWTNSKIGTNAAAAAAAEGISLHRQTGGTVVGRIGK